MASSGTIQGTVTNKSNHFSYYLKWSAEQSIAENASYVTVTAYWSTDNRAYEFDTVGKRTAFIIINGEKTSVSQRFNCNPWPSSGVFAIQTVSRKKVTHLDDGTKSISISASADGTANNGDNHYGPSYNSSQPCTASSTITLDAIPRYATITSAPNFTDNDDPTIIYSNPLGDSVTSLEACISFTGGNDDISYRAIDKTGSSYKFELTDAERDVLRNGTTSASRTVKFFVTTVYNGVTYFSIADKTLTIEETEDTRPSVSVAVSANNGSLPATFNGLYIQGKTKVNATVTAQGKYNATISSRKTTIDGRTYSGTSVTSTELNTPGSLTVTSTATDSRGQTGSGTASITVLAYRPPNVVHITGESIVDCYRSDSTGNPTGDGTYIWIKAKKSYYPLTVDGTAKNTCKLRWRSKLSSDQSYGSWTELTTTNDEYNGDIGGSYAITSAYTIQIGVLDDIGEASTLTFDISTFKPTIHLGAGGDSIGIGQYADTSKHNSLSVADDWTGYFNGGLYGSHKNELAGDVLAFALDCDNGLTPFFTNVDSTNLPTSTGYDFSTGIVHKRTDDQANIYLTNYDTGTIAINVYLDGTWKGWKFITPQ